MLKEQDIARSSNVEGYLIPGRVEDAVKYSLERKGFFIEPHLLNPFLKCMENMKRKVDIELNYSFRLEPYYIVSFKTNDQLISTTSTTY